MPQVPQQDAPRRPSFSTPRFFYTLTEAKIIVESWCRHYNTVRPHGSLGHRPPAPEVFIPALARAALQPQPTMPPAQAPRPSLH